MGECQRLGLHLANIDASVMKLRRSFGIRAFTLIELLAAMAVLALVLAFLVQLSSQTMTATRSSHQQMEASQKGRVVLDSLSADLANLVAQNGLGILVKEGGGNVELAFLTRSRGPKGSATRFLAVAYVLNGNELQRKTAPIDWGAIVLPDSALQAVTSPSSTSVLATGILRFNATATLDDGSIVTISGLPASAKQTNGSSFVQLLPSVSPTSPLLPKVVSLTAAVAPLSEKNLQLAGDMATKLGDLEDGKTALAVWNSSITLGKLAALPAPAVAGLQLSQQTYEIK